MNVAQKRKMFNIPLPSRAIQILANVERYFGKRVREEVVEKWDSLRIISDVGESRVASDGTPVIRIDSAVDRGSIIHKRDVIVHELMHLELRTKGFPNVAFNGETEFMNQIGDSLIRVKAGVWNPIQHYIFDPEIERMGLDSASEIKSDFSEKRRKPIAGDEDDLMLALYYFRAAIEIHDSRMLSDIQRWFMHNGWSNSLKLGRRIAKIVLNLKPRTADEAVATMLNCLNSMFEGVANFSIHRRESTRRGSYVQPLIIFRVDSAR